MKPDTFKALQAQQLPMRVVARDERRVVVANVAQPRPTAP
jgi:hypothetical protein